MQQKHFWKIILGLKMAKIDFFEFISSLSWGLRTLTKGEKN
jgi:hypothetical protein